MATGEANCGDEKSCVRLTSKAAASLEVLVNNPLPPMPKTTRQKIVAKAQPAVKKATAAAQRTVAKSKVAAKQAVRQGQAAVKKAAPKVKAVARKTAKKADGIIDTVKDSVASGLKTVGDFVKQVTPDALLPKSAKAKRK